MMLSLSLIVESAFSSNVALIWSGELQLTLDPVEVVYDPETKQNITNVTTDFDGLPSVTSSQDNKLWLVWQTDVTGNDDVFYKVLSNTWSNDTQLTSDAANDFGPCVLQTADGKIWVFWASVRTGNNEVFYRTTSNGGASWSTETQITNDARSDRSPAVYQMSDGKLWLVWSRKTGTTNEDLFYKTFDGAVWSDETQLTTNTKYDRMPSIVQTSNGKIWVFWGQENPSTQERQVYYKVSVDNGASWSGETAFTTDSNDNADPAVFREMDGTVWIFWSSSRRTQTATSDIFYKNSTDNGVTWSSRFQFTTDSEDDTWPTAVQRMDKSIWIVWTSTRADPVYGEFNVDLYVKATLLGDVGGTGNPRVPDGYIDITDLNIISRALTTTPSSPPGTGWNQWNPDCDFTLDNLIDVDDLYIAGKNFGRNAFGA